MVDFVYGAPKIACRLFQVSVILPPLETFLRAPMFQALAGTVQIYLQSVHLEICHPENIATRVILPHCNWIFDVSVRNNQTLVMRRFFVIALTMLFRHHMSASASILCDMAAWRVMRRAVDATSEEVPGDNRQRHHQQEQPTVVNP